MAFIDNFDGASLDPRWSGSATLDTVNDRVDLSTGSLVGIDGLITSAEWDDLDLTFVLDMSAIDNQVDISLLTNQGGGGVNRVFLHYRTDNSTGTNSIMRLRMDMAAGSFPNDWISVAGLDYTGGPQTFRVTRVSGVWTMYQNGIQRGTYTENATDGTEFAWQFGDIGFVNYYSTAYLHSVSVATTTVNQAPVANDTTYSIQDNVNNGDTVDTYVATDSDGTIASYTITGSTLAIDNAGVITIASNIGIVAGTPITATVTATDNDGATDTALITVNVTEALPNILSTTPLHLSETFTLTTDTDFDLTSATSITVDYAGVTLGHVVVDSTNLTVTLPAEGLLLGVANNLTITVDTKESPAYPVSVDAPTGYDFVTLTAVNTNSWLNDPAYNSNAGGAANNIGIGDTIIYQETVAPSGNSLVIDDEGLITIISGNSLEEDQTFSWYYLDAQDSYLQSNTQVLTVDIASKLPVITLIGDNPLVWVQNQPWVDPGATVTDNVDATRTIVADTSPDVTQVGTQSLTYNTVDVAGNAAIQVTRDVIISGVDTIPDQFSFLDVNNAEISTAYSNVQQITGVDSGQPLTVTNGELSNDGGQTWQTSSLGMVAGQTYVRATLVTSGVYSQEHTITVTVNGISAIFSVTTEALVSRVFNINGENTIVNTLGATITHTYDIWELRTKVPDDETNVLLDSGVSAQIVNGVGAITTSIDQLGVDYLLILRDSGNNPLNYARVWGSLE